MEKILVVVRPQAVMRKGLMTNFPGVKFFSLVGCNDNTESRKVK